MSSEIWKVQGFEGAFCVKRALARLSVAAEWRAPTRRTRYERRWFEWADTIIPGCAPAILAADDRAGIFAMAFLDPANHRLWKSELMAGRVDVGFAATAGERLGRLHAAAARTPELARRFTTDAIFHALRLDAYLLEAARRNRVAAPALRAIVERTAATRLTLVHGDVSPKNILAGPAGPVFLDAETAWWGDPAFDLAFCLNHLLLKRLAVPTSAAALQRSFTAFSEAYLAKVDWEPREAVEGRAATLAPGLFLARVDGKSPVEYLDAGQRRAVRKAALDWLAHPTSRLKDLTYRNADLG